MVHNFNPDVGGRDSLQIEFQDSQNYNIEKPRVSLSLSYTNTYTHSQNYYIEKPCVT